MRKPIFVRFISESEREQLEARLRSSDAFVLRRCQVVLARARGQRAPAIAERVGCDDETVHDLIRAFNERGLGVLQRGSTPPDPSSLQYRPDGTLTRELAPKSAPLW